MARQQSRPLGQRVAFGAAWMVVRTVGVRIIKSLGQLVVAAILLPEQFGLFGLVLTVTAFANVIQQGGIREVLIRRADRIDRWVNPAAWMATSIGLLTGGLMVALAPLVAKLYGEPQLTAMLLVMALVYPVRSLGAVPMAIVESRMRYRLIATIGVIHAVVMMGLTIALAVMGMGAMSFVIPHPIAVALNVGILWYAARPKLRPKPQIRRWRYLSADVFRLIVTALLLAFILQGDYIALGMFHSAAVVGYYFFAFNLSLQTLQLVGTNLSRVLLPAFTWVDADRQRQRRAFLQVIGMMSTVGAPLCVMQAALAEPGLKLLFGDKWDSAIPLLQVLSIGMAIRMIGGPSSSLIKAQGRYRLLLRLNLTSAAAFGATVFLCAWLAGPVVMAITSSLFFTVFGLVLAYAAHRRNGGRFAEILRITMPSLVLSLLAFGAAYDVSLLINCRPFWAEHFSRIAVIAVGGSALYATFLYTLDRPAWNQAVQRLRTLRQRDSGASPDVTAMRREEMTG